MVPGGLVARAASLGVEVLGITDHDTTAGLPEALAEAARCGVRVVPGVEISSVSGREEIHLLGYFVEPDQPALQATLAETQASRRERAKKMLDRLANLGMAVEWARLIEVAGDSHAIGRPHVAATLLEAGYVSTFGEAFDLWIGRGCPAYVERRKLSPEDAIELIGRSGGLAVLAHPYVYDRGGNCRVSLDLARWLPRLRKAGLQGIEVYYPNYPRRVCRQLLGLAVQHGLLVTGGSDFHGGCLGNGLGSVAVPWAAWQGLERRHRLRQAGHAHRARSRTRPAVELASGQV